MERNCKINEKVVLKEGRIVRDGTPDRVLTETVLQEVFGIHATHATVLKDPVAGTPIFLPHSIVHNVKDNEMLNVCASRANRPRINDHLWSISCGSFLHPKMICDHNDGKYREIMDV